MRDEMRRDGEKERTARGARPPRGRKLQSAAPERCISRALGTWRGLSHPSRVPDTEPLRSVNEIRRTVYARDSRISYFLKSRESVVVPCVPCKVVREDAVKSVDNFFYIKEIVKVKDFACQAFHLRGNATLEYSKNRKKFF